ncbi:GntR family transcriptional regulator [Streptosporangium saharense]|uniref:GntR family transcriptional regulator n=1 Tax=Streptosporangium saharense TaxID=1706840 RepID=A0A7W7QS94_9ACTN|nr:GntR family transcriptional regulator [Streptosporangium saharense]MBB4918251.1 GntR family transcriptional regulator [Streptosporangium saharense]
MKPDTRDQSERIAADLRVQITTGQLPPGARLPSIPVLAAERGVSTTAVQAAWDILKAEGYLVSETGKGVSVRDHHQFTMDVTAYFDPAERGIEYRVLVVAEVEAPVDVAAALGEERAVLRHRLMLHQDEPVELSWSYYPVSLAVGTPLAEQRKLQGGAPRVLRELGYPEREFVDRLSARLPTIEEAEALDIPQGVPVLRQFRTVYSTDERPVEVSVIIKPGHLYELSYRQSVSVDDQR